MLPSVTTGQIAHHFCLCCLSWFNISLSVTVASCTDEKNQNQKGSPTRGKGAKVVDTSQQRDGEDGTAGKSDSSSDQSLPPTETMVSMTTACVVSAVAQTLYWSHLHTHTSVHLTFPSLSFSPTCLLPVLISIFHCQIHITPYLQACTHTHTHTPTQTFSYRQNLQEQSSRNWRGGFVVTVWLISTCQGAVICAWFMSHSIVWRPPIWQTCYHSCDDCQSI